MSKKGKIIEYKIVCGNSCNVVCVLVNELIAKGWELRGGLKEGPRQVMVKRGPAPQRPDTGVR